MAPKRIAIIEQGEILGGAERYMLDLLRGMDGIERRTLQPVVIGASSLDYRDALPDWAQVVRFALPSFKGHALKKLWAGVRLWGAAWRLRGQLRALGVTTTVTNTPRAHFAVLLARVLGWRGRWVMIVHDFHTQKRLWAQVHRWLRRRILQAADTIVAVSIPTRARVRAYLTEAEYPKMRIIENGLDFTTYPPAVPPTALRRVVLMARLDYRKGQLHLINAARLLKERLPGVQFRLVGSSYRGDPMTVAYENQCWRAVRDHGLEETVKLVGEVPDGLAELREADLVCCLNVEDETFGRVAIEALALGKPVLSFDCAGPRDIIGQYLRWSQITPPVPLVLPLGDHVDLAATILYLAETPSHLAAIAARGREFVASHYDLADSRKRFYQLLGEG